MAALWFVVFFQSLLKSSVNLRVILNISFQLATKDRPPVVRHFGSGWDICSKTEQFSHTLTNTSRYYPNDKGLHTRMGKSDVLEKHYFPTTNAYILTLSFNPESEQQATTKCCRDEARTEVKGQSVNIVVSFQQPHCP